MTSCKPTPPLNPPLLCWNPHSPNGTCTVTEQVMAWRRGCDEGRCKVRTCTSWFVIIVALSVSVGMSLTCQHCYKAWVPWAATNIQHIRYGLSCNFSLSFWSWVSFSWFSSKCKLIPVCYLTWRVFGRCLYYTVLGMSQYLYSNSMDDRVLWKHHWNRLYYLLWVWVFYCIVISSKHGKNERWRI